MARTIGIDEVGYGPVLGPLVVAAVGVEDPAALERAAKIVWIGDSKQAYRRREDLSRLARTAAVFLDLAGGAETLGAAVARYGAGSLDDRPWYAPPYPLEKPPDLPELVARAREALGDSTVSLRVAFVDPPQFNARLQREGNKATALFTIFADVLRGALADEAGPVRVLADAQGSRRSYLALLKRHLPEHEWRPVEELRRSCRYTAPNLRLQFHVAADARWRVVGLASMIAKYLRESAMRAFVRYWDAEVEAPTGYPNERTRAFVTRVLMPRIEAGELSAMDVLRSR